ncbi:hypothetical protein ACFQ1L_36530 [Phytohabitans flavus]|uniref:hypothetical protein n=1 Tax=Phytohabitans flavus TaxID=1076124 RepID=UPI0036432A96
MTKVDDVADDQVRAVRLGHGIDAREVQVQPGVDEELGDLGEVGVAQREAPLPPARGLREQVGQRRAGRCERQVGRGASQSGVGGHQYVVAGGVGGPRQRQQRQQVAVGRHGREEDAHDVLLDLEVWDGLNPTGPGLGA